MNEVEINPSYFSLKAAGMRLLKKYIRWGFSTICIKTEKEKTVRAHKSTPDLQQ